ncbi:unnamed protein product [Acanthoscelides obtectus]|uniref:Uncharacterized protein n=1 Tax=Acanthoscelides obtectus TaxID=200917 RepID=A0A9P0L4R0_ACAOB|nr:unnamed protein product [Acanthoscelides obtectus]CAK1660426.1 hypothetical protein AOBTE_LOCUS22053 [Acanthoscelides obtectus]
MKPKHGEFDEDEDTSFCSVDDFIDAEVSVILKELIKHKNFIIKSQQQRINSLLAQISSLSQLPSTTSINEAKELPSKYRRELVPQSYSQATLHQKGKKSADKPSKVCTIVRWFYLHYE